MLRLVPELFPSQNLGSAKVGLWGQGHLSVLLDFLTCQDVHGSCLAATAAQHGRHCGHQPREDELTARLACAQMPGTMSAKLKIPMQQ